MLCQRSLTKLNFDLREKLQCGLNTAQQSQKLFSMEFEIEPDWYLIFGADTDANIRR